MDEEYSIDDRISDDLCALKMHLEDHVKYKKDPKKSFYANKIKEKEFHMAINFQKKIFDLTCEYLEFDNQQGANRHEGHDDAKSWLCILLENATSYTTKVRLINSFSNFAESVERICDPKLNSVKKILEDIFADFTKSKLFER